MNLIEITTKFPTELDAIEYFERVRWKGKIHCPFCNSTTTGNRNADYRWHCKACDKSYSVTTGTMLHNTRMPLQTWLFAFSVITDAKKGLSALQLQRNLNISYPTALSMYHKIREFMIIENNELADLDGVIEMDETYVGGKPRKQANYEGFPQKKRKDLDKQLKELKAQGFDIRKGDKKQLADINVRRGRGTDKVPVTGIVQRDGNVVVQVMKHLTYAELSKMVQKHVDMDESVIITDEYKGYSKFDKIIEHVKIEHEKFFSYKGLNTNTIESFWAIIKRQIIGQHHSVSIKHLPKYVAEAAFKFNNRKEDDMFDTLVKFSMIEKGGL